jgi:hypothetical protein
MKINELLFSGDGHQSIFMRIKTHYVSHDGMADHADDSSHVT